MILKQIMAFDFSTYLLMYYIVSSLNANCIKIFYAIENYREDDQFYCKNSFWLAEDYVQIACAQIKQLESSYRLINEATTCDFFPRTEIWGKRVEEVGGGGGK